MPTFQVWCADYLFKVYQVLWGWRLKIRFITKFITWNRVYQETAFFSPVSASVQWGYLEERVTENVKKNEDETAISQWIRYFPCSLLLKKYLWQPNIKRMNLNVTSRKYLQGQRSVSLIFYLNGTMRVHILNSGTWTRISYHEESWIYF